MVKTMSKPIIRFVPKVQKPFNQIANRNWEQKLIKSILKTTPRASEPEGFTKIANRNMPKSINY